jgi:sulfatase modifying factor 1
LKWAIRSGIGEELGRGSGAYCNAKKFLYVKYCVTFDEYDAFCDDTGRSKPEDKNWGRRKRPVIHVSWYDAIEYCNWLSKREGFTPFYRMNGCGISENWCADGYLLPTEAEWEHAVRERERQSG